ncbi:MAG: sigma 54-interacting transcriptional regulator [Acidobacteria bacterium]|nr:sigma 54-interacting transcriptional regulator [Acidobacteriota bacterium]
MIVDLDSFNRTFVNGIPIKEKLLDEGDRIEIGNVILLFLISNEIDHSESLVGFDDSLSVTESAVRLQRDKAVYLNPEIVPTLNPSKQVLQDLNALLKISNTINAINDSLKLQNELLRNISEALPATRIAILLIEDQSNEIISKCTWTIDENRSKKITISRTVVNQVMDEGVSLLCQDIKTEERISHAESLIASQIISILCVPITAFDKTLGVIYAETDGTLAFEESNLQFLTAVAAITAVALLNVQRLQQLECNNQILNEQINLQHTMIGENQRMREIYRLISRVAPTDSTVLILGESGTGKELAARAIHQNSTRAGKPFLAINCAVLTDTLLESELFGHERGAFTGAVSLKHGKLELANGSTLFLDEVGELPLIVQAKLLRVLQEREFERVGGNKSIKVDVRIVAATNRNLQQEVREGRFRQDLYYRLNIIAFEMPPLRERKSDIPLLSSYFIAKHSERCKRRVKSVSPEAQELLKNYYWSGNVRELENVIERAVVLGQTEIILSEDLPENILEATYMNGSNNTQTNLGGLYTALKQEKKRLISEALEMNNGNHSGAAKLLGIHTNNLYRLIRDLDIKIGKV